MQAGCKHLLACLVALLVLAGCEPRRTYIIGDEAFTLEERVQIEAGAAYISAATGRQVPEIRWEPLPAVGRDMVIERADMPEGTGGDCGLGEWTVRIDPSQSGDALARVAAHELGHGLGLPHLPVAEDGLMTRFRLTAGVQWSNADESECSLVGVCEAKGK